MTNTKNISVQSEYNAIADYMYEGDAEELTEIFGGDYDNEYLAEQDCQTEAEKEAIIAVAKTDWVYGFISCYSLSVVLRKFPENYIIGYSLSGSDKGSDTKRYEAINWNLPDKSYLDKVYAVQALLKFFNQEKFKKVKLTIKDRMEYFAIKHSETVQYFEPTNLGLDADYGQGIDVTVVLQ